MYLGLRDTKGRPGACLHVTLQAALPGKLGVSAQMVGGLEIHAAGVTGGGRQAHLGHHMGVGDFVLDSPGHAERRLPGAISAGREVDMAVECAFVRILFILISIPESYMTCSSPASTTSWYPGFSLRKSAAEWAIVSSQSI